LETTDRLITYKKQTEYHIPVLLDESVEGLKIKPFGIYVDATFGGGGHSRAIIDMLNDKGKLFAFDRDADSEANAIDDQRFTFVRGDFRFMSNFLRYHGVGAVDGIIADLGVSSHHFDDSTRGFSFRYEDATLDMRMNNRAGMTAADVINNYDAERLAELFYRYGELTCSRKMAAALVAARSIEPVVSVSRLMSVLAPFKGKEPANRFLAKAFQAIRLEVNGEIEALEEFLFQTPQLLKPDGRLVVISYHSLEDRLVKNFIKTGTIDGQADTDIYGNRSAPLKPIGKPVTPKASETAANPRSRSAKMRIGEKQTINKNII
jgi:16S rRNA (cytosine1402-N4)-methyltransferase